MVQRAARGVWRRPVGGRFPFCLADEAHATAPEGRLRRQAVARCAHGAPAPRLPRAHRPRERPAAAALRTAAAARRSAFPFRTAAAARRSAFPIRTTAAARRSALPFRTTAAARRSALPFRTTAAARRSAFPFRTTAAARRSARGSRGLRRAATAGAPAARRGRGLPVRRGRLAQRRGRGPGRGRLGERQERRRAERRGAGPLADQPGQPLGLDRPAQDLVRRLRRPRHVPGLVPARLFLNERLPLRPGGVDPRGRSHRLRPRGGGGQRQPRRRPLRAERHALLVPRGLRGDPDLRELQRPGAPHPAPGARRHHPRREGVHAQQDRRPVHLRRRAPAPAPERHGRRRPRGRRHQRGLPRPRLDGHAKAPGPGLPAPDQHEPRLQARQLGRRRRGHRGRARQGVHRRSRSPADQPHRALRPGDQPGRLLPDLPRRRVPVQEGAAVPRVHARHPGEPAGLRVSHRPGLAR